MIKKVIIGVVVAVIVIIGIVFIVMRGKDNGDAVNVVGEDYVAFEGVETKSFEAPEYGLKFLYPPDFALQESRIPGKRVIVAGEEEIIPPVLNVTLTFEGVVYALAVNNPSVGFDDFPPSSDEDIIVRGHRVAHNSYFDYDADNELLVYYIEDSGNQFYWIGSITINDSESKSLLEEIIRSMTFTPPVNAE